MCITWYEVKSPSGLRFFFSIWDTRCVFSQRIKTTVLTIVSPHYRKLKKPPRINEGLVSLQLLRGEWAITNYKLSLLMNCQCDSIQGRAAIALLVPSTFVLTLLPILGPDGFNPLALARFGAYLDRSLIVWAWRTRPLTLETWGVVKARSDSNPQKGHSRGWTNWLIGAISWKSPQELQVYL